MLPIKERGVGTTVERAAFPPIGCDARDGSSLFGYNDLPGNRRRAAARFGNIHRNAQKNASRECHVRFTLRFRSNNHVLRGFAPTVSAKQIQLCYCIYM